MEATQAPLRLKHGLDPWATACPWLDVGRKGLVWGLGGVLEGAALAAAGRHVRTLSRSVRRTMCTRRICSCGGCRWR